MKKQNYNLIAATLLAVGCLLSFKATAQPGTLDPTFGTGGKVTTASIGNLQSIKIQSNGKIVAAGGNKLVRYLNNGTLDNTFGTSGIVTLTTLAANAVALQNDGKILVAGGSGTDIAVARYDTAGLLDNSFGTAGSVITNIGNWLDVAFGMEVQPDGKILVTGESENSSTNNSNAVLLRYTGNGILDASFGVNGIASCIWNWSFEYDISHSVALQNDGKILIAGDASGRFGVARFDTAGVLDNTFGNNGTVVTNISPGAYSPAYSVTVQNDGKIIVAGDSINSVAVAMARYNSIGTLDSSFGINGVVTAIASQWTGRPSVVVQNNGKILLEGSDLNLNNGDFILLRYDSTGTLDNTFGTAGKATTDFALGSDAANAMAIQPDGKIIIAGYGNGFELARYIGDDIPSAIEQIIEAQHITAYPIPFTDHLTIKSVDAKGVIKLFDVFGNEVLFQKVTYSETILNTAELANGIYVLNYTNESENINTKLLRAH